MEGSLGLLPLEHGLSGIAGQRLPLAVLPGHFPVGFFRLTPRPLRLALRFSQGATALAEGVKVIQLLADRLPLLVPPSLVDAGQAVLQTRAAVADEVLQRGQSLQFFGPLLAVTAWGKATAQPAVALGLNHHEYGLLAEEDLVGTGLADPRSSV